MATRDLCFDNRLGARMLTSEQVDSLVGQEAIVTAHHDHTTAFGKVVVKAAGAWDDRRIDMIVEGEEHVLRRFGPLDERPQVSIGYRVVDGITLDLQEVTVLGHPPTLELPQGDIDRQIDALHGAGATAALDAAIADGSVFGDLSPEDKADAGIYARYFFQTEDGDEVGPFDTYAEAEAEAASRG